MSKFKWIAVLGILLLLMFPIGVLFLPSFNAKLSPMLNLVSTLMGENAADKMTLGSFSFVGSDETTLTLRIDLGINNTEGQDMLFPAVNLTFNYGSDQLGDGWINPEVFIPAGFVTLVPIYAKMQKGEAFNKFLYSLIGGGLSLSIGGGQAFVFLNTFGGSQAGVLTIPLPSIPLPSIDLGGATFWPPTIHRVFRGNVSAGVPVNVVANVTDRGSGVRTVILSWTNGTGWVNTTMSGLPMKLPFGGAATTIGGAILTAFPHYPASPILTACPGVFGIVSGEIPAHPIGTPIQYRLYVIDDYKHVTLVPSTAPTYTAGASDTLDLLAHTFNYTVAATSTGNYTAVWLPQGGAPEGGGLQDMMDALAANGVDIFGAIMAGSSALGGELSIDLLFSIILPLIQYFEERGVNPFEVVDQLLGFSGGTPLAGDPDPHINANASVALDLMAEGGIGLTELITALDVNLTKVVDSLGNSVLPPLSGFATITEGVSTLLNQTFWDAGQNKSFFDFLEANDLIYLDRSVIVFKYNQTDWTWTNLTAQSFSLEGDPLVEYYFGSMTAKDLFGGSIPGENFSALHMEVATPANPAIGGKYEWDYYYSGWMPLPVVTDLTANLTGSGRVFFDPAATAAMQTQAVGSPAIDTRWVRLRIVAPINASIAPLISAVHYSMDYVPYYFTTLSVDMLGRANKALIPGEMDSYANLMRSINKTPAYGMVLWSLLRYRGISYPTFVQLIGGEQMTIEGPVTGAQIITTTAPMLALIVYGVVLIALLAAIRGRKGAYAITPLRVKKWYDSVLVTPTLKSREEIEKYKIK